jgi:hypothetical protein
MRSHGIGRELLQWVQAQYRGVPGWAAAHIGASPEGVAPSSRTANGFWNHDGRSWILARPACSEMARTVMSKRSLGSTGRSAKQREHSC